MNSNRRLVLIYFLCFLPVVLSAATRQGKELARMLQDILTVEQVHPDSVYPYIQRVEQARASVCSDSQRAVYTLALGVLYRVRAHAANYAGYADYEHRSEDCFNEVFAQCDLLAQIPARDWIPVTTDGTDDIFGGDMLHIAWQVCNQYPRLSSLPATRDMIAFYQARGNRKATLYLKLDTLSSCSYGKEKDSLMCALITEYGDLDLCAEVYLVLGTQTHHSPNENRQWLEQGLSLYPQYKYKSKLQNALLRLYEPSFSWVGPSHVYPADSCLWYFSTNNIQSVDYGKERFLIPDTSSICPRKDSLMWTAPSVSGKYTLTFVPRTKARIKDKISPLKEEVLVTRLQLLCQGLPDGRAQIFVVDAKSGAPVPGAQVYVLRKDSTVAECQTTNAEGRTWVKNPDKRRSLWVRVCTAEETTLDPVYLYMHSSYTTTPTDSTTYVRLYTDRAVYRPGQTLHVGGVAYRQLAWETQVAEGLQQTVVLRDAQGKERERRTVTTDSLGVFAVDFTLPADGRNGTWSVATNRSRQTFRVEEYKRPTFQVVLTDAPHRQGDTLRVSGRATHYDGTPLRQARVTGTWQSVSCWWANRYAPRHSLDTLCTDADGAFIYSIKRDSTYSGVRFEVDVLSSSGEQQQTSNWYRTGPDEPRPQPKVDSTFIFRCEKDTFDREHPARFVLSSNCRDVYLYYTLASSDQVVKDTLIRFSNDSLSFVIPYDEAYGTTASASFCFVKNGRVYTTTRRLYLAQPDTRLRLRWDSFRDRVTPGQTEEWKLSLYTPDGQPARANVMATLFDASLDRFATQKWSLSLGRGYASCALYYNYSRQDGTKHLSRTYPMQLKKERERKCCMLDENLFVAPNPFRITSRAGSTYLRATALSVSDNISYSKASMHLGAVEDAETTEETVSDDDRTETIPSVSLRENFNETAFFFPALRSDVQGKVSLVFTFPESLTTWRLQAVAHTVDMMTASLSEEVIASKSMTAQLALPRFLRCGDETTLTGSVSNNAEHPVQGKAVMQVLDAQTEKVLQTFRADIRLGVAEDTTLFVPYVATSRDVVVRWIVEGADCSDGEQRLLPVLPVSVALTKTLAYAVDGPGVRTLQVDTLFPEGVEQRKLTIEYTTHPEQYALRALSALTIAQRNDVLSLASAYYAGRLATALHLNIADSSAVYLSRLQALQQADGCFSWYPGMPSDRYLTYRVAFLLTRLQMLTGDSGCPTLYQRVARSLLDETRLPRCSEFMLLRTLYVIQYAGLDLSAKEKERVDSMRNVVRNLVADELSLDNQALCALVLQQMGMKKKAKQMVDAFSRRLVVTEDRGTYIEFPQGPFFSVDTKLYTHVLLMEALQEVCPENDYLKGMRRYLLAQKRTQAWDTPVNSADAVFVLMRGTRSAEVSPLRDLLTLRCDRNTVVNFMPPADSLGYFCDSLDVVEQSRELRLQKFSQGESWGAVYASFRQTAEEVESASTGLSITFEEPSSAKVGDRMKQLFTLTADKDYQYVTLSVPRAAAFEPVAQRSGYYGQNGLYYYREVKDNCTLYHFHSIPRGTYRLFEESYVERQGIYHSGIPRIQCVYAPEYCGYGKDRKMTIDK